MASSLQLVDAAEYGRADEVDALIASGLDVNEVDQWDSTALGQACRYGHTTVVTRLLAAGAEVDKANNSGYTPLHLASRKGHADVASLLLDAGAQVNKADMYGDTPLSEASYEGHADIASLLLAAGAEVNKANTFGYTPLWIACMYDHLDVVKLRSSYGASRTWAGGGTAEGTAARRGHTDVRDWLVLSRHWTAPLHHLTLIDAARARALLRDGADIRAAKPNAPDAPTPVSLAQALHAAGNAPAGSLADLVLQAARPWSRETHALFPARARARAWTLVLLGHRLSRQPRFAGEEQALMDLWLEKVLPHAVTRATSHEPENGGVAKDVHARRTTSLICAVM